MDPLDIPLRDIHLPEPISWWPPAIGWWVLVGVIFALVIAGLVYLYIRRQRRLRRAALAALTQIETEFADHGDTGRLARDLSALTRRIVLGLTDRREHAAIVGTAWTTYLDTLLPEAVDRGVVEHALLHAPYEEKPELDGGATLQAFRTWFSELSPLKTGTP